MYTCFNRYSMINQPGEIVKVVHDDGDEEVEDEEGGHDEEGDEVRVGEGGAATVRVPRLVAVRVTLNRSSAI